MADVQELLARLNSQTVSSGGASGSHQSGYQRPSVSSPIFSPTPTGPHPHHPSAIMSPNISSANTPVPEQASSDRQNALLNLLRFNAPAAPSQQPAFPERRPPQNLQPIEASGGHARTTSASDLVASFMRKSSPQGPTSSSAAATPVPKAETSSGTQENPQDLLLRLLNHPKPSVESPAPSTLPEMAADDKAEDSIDDKSEKTISDQMRARTESPMRLFGTDGAMASRFTPEAMQKTVFTYVNPFEQLSAASSRNRTPAPEAASLTPAKSEVQDSKSDRAASPDTAAQNLFPERTSHDQKSISEAVTDLAGEIGQEVAEALAADYRPDGPTAEESEKIVLSKFDIKEAEQAIHDVAVEIKEELQDEDNRRAFEESLPKPVADALKEVVDDVAEADIADSWESAEAETDPSKSEKQTVHVYRFPMRAFASISVTKMPEQALTLRNESIMDIARLKKEFDQIDRSLVTASKNFIVYALAKSSGFRIIRQENGTYRQVFQNHQERIFNVGICTPGDRLDADTLPESILGIGVNGTVFWTSLVPAREDQIEDLDVQGLILPPMPAQDDNTSGGQLKTRAKPSSRHPDYFAVGRGKSIHIVWPKVAAAYVRPKTRVCNTEKYLKERSLKILTGKAGKDFTFSGDDTVIVSLDKAGRMRFWDIRSLTHESLGDPYGPPNTLEVSQTLLEFHTTSPTAKSWPTSVFFFDKDKPFNKGIALRYVMVGMKQNHTFQLWDLGLGKAVQEINLPHEKESDAICSVSFHPRTGIMAVGHPTRNSIYFIHVSCPRYNLPVMTQAGYITRLADKGGKTQLPAVNATAIMTSITEYSFSSKGQLRSLYMLNEPLGPPDVDEPENNSLFELYVMHSKGVCTISVRRSDIGWKKEGEPLHPIEAEEVGVINISPLRPAPPAPEEQSTSGDTSAAKSTSERSVRENLKKESSSASRQSMTPEAAMRASTLAKVESKQDAARAAIINGGEKTEKKKKKRATTDTSSQPSSAASKPSSYAQAVQTAPRAKTPSPQEPSTESAPSKSAETPEWAQKLISQFVQQQASSSVSSSEPDVKKLGDIVQTEFTKILSRELDDLYTRFEEDKRVQAAANAAKQDAVLRLVSSTLTENVHKTLVQIVNDSVSKILLPGLNASTTSTLETLKMTSDTKIAKQVSESIARASKDPVVITTLADQVSNKVKDVGPAVSASVESLLKPALASMSATIERQREDLRQALMQRRDDAVKIDQLTNMVQSLTQTVQTLATSQADLSNQLLKLEQTLSKQRPTEGSQTHTSPHTARSNSKPVPKSPQQLEVENITRLMADGKYEQGTMAWLQSQHSAELFNTVFVHCNPAYLRQVSALLALSTGAIVTESLDAHLTERLIWLDTVLKNIDPRDPEIREVVPRIMDVINQRLTAAYIKLNEAAPGHQTLRTISVLVNKVNELAHAAPFA